MTGSEMILWTVSLVIGILVTPGECVGISQSGVSVHLGHRDRKMNVQYFNDLRRDIGAADMNALTWDLSIAKEARRLGRSCDFSKRPDTEYPSALYKQLFDPTARPGEIIMNAIRFWASQKSNFTRFGWKSCEERNTCEYIKMITASAENAACSLTRCSHMRRQRQDEEANMYFVTCLFSPATDMAKPPFSKGRKCSRCPVYSGCRRGLCSSLGKRFSNKKKYPSPDKNRVVSLPGAKDVTPIKGSLIQGHRYLDAEGNIRIRTIPKYLAQTGRGPSYFYRPPRTRLHSQRPTRLNDRESQGRGAVRGVPAQGARVKRQSDRDSRYHRLQRQREEQRRREEQERLRRERQRRQWEAQQLRQRAGETRSEAEYQRRILEEQRRRNEELRQREEQRRQREEEIRRRKEERRRRERQRERSQQQGPQRLESPMGSTDKFQLTQVHNTLRGTQLAELSWSNHLERWARYVIRCEIEYPGPIDTFTNFGKVDRTSRVYNIIYDWGAEGSDVNQRQNVGCRTPDDREKCNHNSIIRNPFIRNFACASLDCGSKTQLTCIYK